MGEGRDLKSTMLLGLEYLGHTVLSGLDENPISALVAGLASRSGFGPCHEAAVNALVANLQGVHGRVAMATLLLRSRVVSPLVGPVAVPALV